MGDAVEAAQLVQGFGMIVDAQIQDGVGLVTPDLDGRRLLAPLVAAFRLSRIERRHEALGERQVGTTLVGIERRLDHCRACQHVAGDGDAFIREVPAPVDAVAARMGRGAAVPVDHMKLAGFPAPDRPR